MEKINIAELLKDCPKGMELDCTMYENVEFDYIEQNSELVYPIHCLMKINGGYNALVFTHNGCNDRHPNAKCVIFPKGKTTWEGFQRPFKDGDIVTWEDRGSLVAFIYKERKDIALVKHHFALYTGSLGIVTDGEISLVENEIVFATEEEKQKLFDAIKENGYKWNTETKTLEKLVDMEDKGNISDGYHTFNELYEYRLLYNASMFNELAKQGLYDVHKSKKHSDGTAPFGDGNWFIVQAELPTGQISNHYEMKDWELFNVPEKEKANPYDGHTPQNVAKRLRDFLTLDKLIKPKFKVGDKVRHKNNHGVVFTITSIAEDSYVCGTKAAFWFDDQDNYELVPNKFDITTLKPFESRVLVRDSEMGIWLPDFFGCLDNSNECPYMVVGGIRWKYCIPYEGNEHLLGKTEECKDFYKNW